MNTALQRCRAALQRQGGDLRHALRVTIAVIVTFGFAHLLQLPQGFWAVLTALLVMQANLGASLKAALERVVGTVSGAAYGAMIAWLLPHDTPWEQLLKLAVGTAPLAFLAAVRPAFRVAPVTVIIVLFSPQNQHIGIGLYALERVGEILLGSLIGLAVALLVFPARAHHLLRRATGDTLKIFAALIPTLLAGAEADADRVAIEGAHKKIRAALGKLENVAQDALHERRGHLSPAHDPEPLLRSLRRVRHDLVMLGRAMAQPLPESVAPQLLPPLRQVAAAAGNFLQATGQALGDGQSLPAPAYDAAFAAYATAMAETRATGVLRTLPADAVGRVFALAFSLEQLQDNLRALHGRAAAGFGA